MARLPSQAPAPHHGRMEAGPVVDPRGMVRAEPAVHAVAGGGWVLEAGAGRRRGDVVFGCSCLTPLMSPPLVECAGLLRRSHRCSGQEGQRGQLHDPPQECACQRSTVTAPVGWETEMAASTSPFGIVAHLSTAFAISATTPAQSCSPCPPCWTKVHYAARRRPSHNLVACTLIFRVGCR